MSQPIPKKIIETNDLPSEKPFYTLLIDMNSLMKTCMVDNRVNTKGETYGMIFQTLLQIKLLMSKKDFDNVYAVYDGDLGGQLRCSLLIDYKSNRGKDYDFSGTESQYYKNIDKFVKRVLDNKNKQLDPKKINEDQSFFRQKKILEEMLEELFIRQISADKVEADDLIAYYCNNKKDSDRVYIVSNDMDLSQLISDGNYICQYMPRLKKFITEERFKTEFGFLNTNIVTKKILCGDQSDVIKGVKGLGDKTLFDIMPEMKERPVKLYEVIARTKELRDERNKDKKKGLKVYENIINQITDGSHPEGKLFEINEKIINLKKPLLTDEAIEMMDNIMYTPIDPDGRSMGNLYKLILRDDITELLDNNRFSSFFSTFNKSIEKEKKFYEEWKKVNI